MLTQEIAMEIVKQTTNRLNRNINIMDEKGTIIASGNRERIDQLHFGAMEVLKTGKPLIIHEKDRHQWAGVLPGINLPINFQNVIIGVIGITGDPTELLEFGELVKMITEMMLHQAFMVEQLEWKQHLKELVFEDLLKEEINQHSIDQRLELIGMKLEPPYQVGVMEMKLNPLNKSELIQMTETVFGTQHALVGFLNVNRVFILTTALTENNIGQRLDTVIKQLKAKGFVIRIGLGSLVEKESYICHSFREAESALSLGEANQALTIYTDVETKALLERIDERTKQQFQERILGSLSEKLIETLQQFFLSNLNIGECAKRMYIHRNSLIYRLKKIKEITGYNPQVLHDAITLQLAIWVSQSKKRS
ncbi:sugar diacid recognition domain-containing protein [Peribacillus simplex]|uniref:Sugar diacid recognition domain-containing protein n=2 Tax=Peribacillus TaxID=2675229 RepID=A0AA90PJ64_9BACI|nr:MULTISPECIES: sugar diacid recognition domain-containing protein [Peribacillus]MDP1419022.1 sugar diacid recognition domain-containing protein [Peribacillus simplex]MDP1451715.1 sugar diacid recognition domain-containing protein [Peribacillus frigoritolerans]